MSSHSAHEDRNFWVDLLTRDDDDDDYDTDLESEPPPSPQSRSRSPSVSSDADTDMDTGTDTVANEPVETPSALATKVKQVLAQMSALGLTLPQFLHAVSWGDADCVKDPQVRGARTALMNSSELPTILHNWWKPPCSTVSHKSRSKAARSTMEAFALQCLREVLDRELDDVMTMMKTPDDVSEEFYTSTTFADLAEDVKATAPILWSLLRRSAYMEKQERRNSRKNPTKIVLLVVAILCYTRNHHSNRLQKLFAIYLKFCGLSAKAFDTLHALAITMSHKWTANHVSKLSAAAMKEVTDLKTLFPWLVSYDNINIPFKVFSQRLDNKDKFSSGVAATVYIKCQADHLDADINKALQEYRDRGMQDSLTTHDIFMINQQSYPHVYRHSIYTVLRILLDSPESNLKTYEGRDNPLLSPPFPVHALPCGPEHATHQYLLGSVNIPEQSYADNEHVVDEILRQLGLTGSMEKESHLAREKVVVWLGDQLTIDRLRGLFKYRSQDANSFDRLDWMVLVFGWLHLQMAFANSLHKQYLGTAAGHGLQQAFTLLGRKGLHTVATVMLGLVEQA